MRNSNYAEYCPISTTINLWNGFKLWKIDLISSIISSVERWESFSYSNLNSKLTASTRSQNSINFSRYGTNPIWKITSSTICVAICVTIFTQYSNSQFNSIRNIVVVVSIIETSQISRYIGLISYNAHSMKYQLNRVRSLRERAIQWWRSPTRSAIFPTSRHAVLFTELPPHLFPLLSPVSDYHLSRSAVSAAYEAVRWWNLLMTIFSLSESIVGLSCMHVGAG